jgi:hypothetical protein
MSTPINPGPGYRLLIKGEDYVLDGDEFTDDGGESWEPPPVYSMGKLHCSYQLPYRRRITNVNQPTPTTMDNQKPTFPCHIVPKNRHAFRGIIHMLFDAGWKNGAYPSIDSAQLYFEKRGDDFGGRGIELSVNSIGKPEWIKTACCDGSEITMEQLADLLAMPIQPTPISVKLNDTHTAIVSTESIVVGCQTFPLTIVEELVEAKRKVMVAQ